VRVVIESKTCDIYKLVLQTIKAVARTPFRISKLVARNHISTKLDWTYDFYSLEGLNQYKTASCFHLRLVLKSCAFHIHLTNIWRWYVDRGVWGHAIHGFVDIQHEVPERHTIPLWITDVRRRGRRKPRVIDLGPNANSPSVGLWKSSILSGWSVNIIDIKRCVFRFESSCRVVLPLCHDVTRTPDQDTYFLALGWNIELLIFGIISWSGFRQTLIWDWR
jgi:hypothetical protein